MTSAISTRFHYQLYLTILAALPIVVVAAIAAWQMTGGKHTVQIILERVSDFESHRLLSADSDPVARRRFLADISTMLDVEVALFDVNNRLIDTVGRNGDVGTFYEAVTPAVGVRLSNGGWIEIRGFSPTRELYNKIKLLAGFSVVIAVFFYPVVRRLTSRLERLQLRVESWGAGDLTARVKVEGGDEVARLAQSFNNAAAQIEQLIGAHRLLLANVSHELRAPLSRLRLAAELLKEVADPMRRANLEKDVIEIDSLIEQMLLSSRLEAIGGLEIHEEVDLLALAAEEGSRCGEDDIAGDPVTVEGDPTLLRRMIRNLIENAQQHGAPPVEVRVSRQGARAVLTVSDRGTGIPPNDRERVFAPFYRLPGTRSQGSGLGLALVRQIARQHSGEASATSTKTYPFIVEIVLPVKDGGALRSAA